MDTIVAHTATDKVKSQLLQYSKELNEELQAIWRYWTKYMPDNQRGGFYGSVNNNNIPDLSAVKGIVLNSRILWSFSAAFRFSGDAKHLAIAKRAFHYITDHFLDRKYGGVVWSVTAMGEIADGRKQIYGLAFCIYGLSEYHKAAGDAMALQIAKELYGCIEQYSFDKKRNGYVEAFAQDWKSIEDLRLSEKDDNETKTMNTHLHVIEAYANLYTVWQEESLRERIVNLLELFDRYFINRDNYHLNLFMDDDWNLRSSLQSYGHDIEAAWLLLECAQTISHEEYINKYKKLSVPIAVAAAEGLDKDGGLWYEYDPKANHLVKEKHSWPQAEAMIGFFNAYRLSGDENYLEKSLKTWEFVQQHLKDNRRGEWLWGIKEDGAAMEKEKAGFWKCPYHNSRACMKLIAGIAVDNSH